MRYLVISLAVLWLLSASAWAATVGQDTFDVASTTPLESHTPTCTGDCGAGAWTVEDTGLSVSSVVDAAFSESTTDAMGRKEDNIGNDEMDCTVTVFSSNISSTRKAGVCARVNADLDNAFCAYVFGNGTDLTLRLAAEEAGVHRTLGTYGTALALSTIHTIKLKIRNGTQAVDVNAVTDAITTTETDATFAGNNYCGIYLNSNNSSTVRVDNFLSESVAGGAARRRGIIINKRFDFPEPKEWLHESYRHLTAAW